MTTGTIAILIVLAMNFAVHLVNDGEPKENYSAGISLISTAIWVLLLWWAGNFG